MSSSEPGGIRRNRRCHTAASARPKTMTRFGNSGVEKSSRMARRYATPATARGMKNDGSPMRLKLREQIVIATSKMAPSPYSLCEGVSFTGLPLMAKLRDCLLPFAEPARSPWRLRGSEPQFPSHQNQHVCDADVVEAPRHPPSTSTNPPPRHTPPHPPPCST